MRLIDADKLRLSYWVSPTSTVSTAGQYYFYDQVEVDNAPTIEAEPIRHGHWEIIYNNNIPYAYRCSLCGTTRIDNGNYCPNCGAAMDERV